MKVNEIFYSLQGEGFHSGTAAVFVRFAGCNLQCPFCDTDFASGIEMSEEEIVEGVSKYGHNPKYLSSTFINPKDVKISNDLRQVVSKADYVVIVTPSAFLQKTLEPLHNIVVHVASGDFRVDHSQQVESMCFFDNRRYF